MERAEHTGLLIAAVRRRIKQAVGTRVRRYHLTVQQFWMLVAIHEHPGYSLGELADHLRMDQPTASRVVFALVGRKLVRVRGDTADRRRARISLRPTAAPLGTELQALAMTVRAAVVQGLSAYEQAALGALLRKIIANMDRFQGDGATRAAQASTTVTTLHRPQP